MSADTPSVTVDVGDRTVPLDDLVERFERGEELRLPEIGALVEYPATGVDVAEWRRLKAKVMFGSNPHVEGDAAAEQAATEWLRELFQEHDVETVADYHDLLKAVGDDHAVQEAVKKLTENATPFERQRESSIMQRLEQQSQEPVEELYRPDDAGDDWDPATDQTLHEFIALMEGVSDDGFHDDMESWQELKEAANFDPEEWPLEDEKPDAGGV
jgi:hypothetical protein